MADFISLANAARPQMMPDAKSPIAGWMYGGDMARHDNLLAQAAQQAKQQAMMDAMKAEEASLARPGRLADIERGNASAQDNLDAYKQFGRDTTMGTAEDKKLSAQEAILGPQTESITALATATTPEEIDSAIQLMKAKGHGRIGPINLTEMPANVAKQLADRIYKSKIETPQLAGKKEIEGIKGDYRLAERAFKEAGLNTRQEKTLAAKMELDKLKTAKPSLYTMLLDAADQDPIKAYNLFLLSKQVGPLIEANSKAGAARAILPKDKAPPDTEPIQVPNPKETQKPKEVTRVKDKEYKDANGNRAIYRGKDAQGNDIWEPVKGKK